MTPQRFNKIADQSAWKSAPAKNGKGYRAFTDGDEAIRYNMNGTRFDAEHFYGDPYWVVSSAAGEVKILF